MYRAEGFLEIQFKFVKGASTRRFILIIRRYTAIPRFLLAFASLLRRDSRAPFCCAGRMIRAGAVFQFFKKSRKREQSRRDRWRSAESSAAARSSPVEILKAFGVRASRAASHSRAARRFELFSMLFSVVRALDSSIHRLSPYLSALVWAAARSVAGF